MYLLLILIGRMIQTTQKDEENKIENTPSLPPTIPIQERDVFDIVDKPSKNKKHHHKKGSKHKRKAKKKITSSQMKPYSAESYPEISIEAQNIYVPTYEQFPISNNSEIKNNETFETDRNLREYQFIREGISEQRSTNRYEQYDEAYNEAKAINHKLKKLLRHELHDVPHEIQNIVGRRLIAKSKHNPNYKNVFTIKKNSYASGNRRVTEYKIDERLISRGGIDDPKPFKTFNLLIIVTSLLIIGVVYTFILKRILHKNNMRKPIFS